MSKSLEWWQIPPQKFIFLQSKKKHKLQRAGPAAQEWGWPGSPAAPGQLPRGTHGRRLGTAALISPRTLGHFLPSWLSISKLGDTAQDLIPVTTLPSPLRSSR